MNVSRRAFRLGSLIAIRTLAIAAAGLLAACGGSSSTTSGPLSQSANGSSGSLVAGTATLSWSPPIVNVDGSILTDLAGYHVYYGTDPSNLQQFANVSGPSQVVFTASNLTAGTWYFTISAYNTAGTESPYTTVDTTIG